MAPASSVVSAKRAIAWKSTWGIAILAALAVGAGWWCWPVPLPNGITQRDYDIATRRFRDLYNRRPNRLDVLSIAGELAVRDDRLAAAAECFHQIPIGHPRYGAAARLQEAQVRLRLNQAVAAEQNFREYLGWMKGGDPESVKLARKWLTYILSVELRFEERHLELAAAHEAGTADLSDSKQFFFPNLLIWNSATGKRRLADFMAADPADFGLQVAHGRYLTGSGQLDDALMTLNELHRQQPGGLSCTAALLECLFEKNDWNQFATIAKTLPEPVAAEPWLLTRMRGEFALHENRWDDAIRAFDRLAEMEPANPWSAMGLAKAYREQNRQAEREATLARALVLSRIRVSLSNVRENNVDAIRNLANECRQLGLAKAADVFDGHAVRIAESNRRAPGHSMIEE